MIPLEYAWASLRDASQAGQEGIDSSLVRLLARPKGCSTDPLRPPANNMVQFCSVSQTKDHRRKGILVTPPRCLERNNYSFRAFRFDFLGLLPWRMFVIGQARDYPRTEQYNRKTLLASSTMLVWWSP